MTLSAFSWPSRFVSAIAGNNFDFNDSGKPIIPSTINLQYVNPVFHLTLLSHIVKSDDGFIKSLKNSIASSIRVDGSIDRTQIDKIYILLRTVAKDGSEKLNFLGIAQQKKPGAAGLMEAVKDAIITNHGSETYKYIMQTVSSIVTDGCSLNTGNRGGFWVLFENEMRKESATQPLLKIWCSAHRMELVWGDLADNFKEIKKTLDMLSSIASYFRQSSLRTEKLHETAKVNNLKVYSLAKLFEIRWTEWSYSAVVKILKSWNALVVYFENDTNARAKGFHKYLTNFKNVEFIAFLADVLNVYQRYQKSVQSDKSTIIKLMKNITTLKSALNKLADEKLPGGWEEEFAKSIERNDEKILLMNIELASENSSRNRSNNNLIEQRKRILASAIELLDQRFKVEYDLTTTLEPFLKFKADANVREIHKIFGSDLSLPSLMLQFNELVQELSHSEVEYFELFKRISKDESSYKEFEEIIIIIGRIHACSPQSADVERSIKANNTLKTVFRSRLLVETENKYLYVHMNMPVLEQWNPRSAIISFIKEKTRRQHSNLLEKQTKKNASYFKGTFDQTEEEENEDVIDAADKTIRF